MVLGRDLITKMGLDLNVSDDFIIGGDGPYEGLSEPIVDVSNYDFTYLTDKTVKLE